MNISQTIKYIVFVRDSQWWFLEAWRGLPLKEYQMKIDFIDCCINQVKLFRKPSKVLCALKEST